LLWARGFIWLVVLGRFEDPRLQSAVLVDNAMVLAGQLALIDAAFYTCADVVQSNGTLDARTWQFLHPDSEFDLADASPPLAAAAGHASAGRPESKSAAFASTLAAADREDFEAAVVHLQKATRVVGAMCPATPPAGKVVVDGVRMEP
jgi:hypothetical protein